MHNAVSALQHEDRVITRISWNELFMLFLRILRWRNMCIFLEATSSWARYSFTRIRNRQINHYLLTHRSRGTSPIQILTMIMQPGNPTKRVSAAASSASASIVGDSSRGAAASSVSASSVGDSSRGAAAKRTRGAAAKRARSFKLWAEASTKVRCDMVLPIPNCALWLQKISVSD